MTHVGITGHQRIRGVARHDGSNVGMGDWAWVRRELERLLGKVPRPLIGHSCLAAGADQLFGEVVLEQGGALEFVRPFPTYRGEIERHAERRVYDALLQKAQRVEDLEGPFSSEDEAYLLAGKAVVDRSEQLLAVWDGQPPRNVGSTAHVVHYAKDRGCPVTVLNPITRTVAALK